MEPLITCLEGALQLLAPVSEGGGNQGGISTGNGTAPSSSHSHSNKWSKHNLFLKFKAECDDYRAVLKAEVLALLSASSVEKDVPRKMYLMSPHETEVSFLTTYIQKFVGVMFFSPDELGDQEDLGLIKLVTEWSNMKKYFIKLKVLLKFFEGILELACLKTIVEIDPSLFPSHSSACRFWKINFEPNQFQVEFRELVHALESDYEFQLRDCYDILRSRLCTKQDMVTVFRLDSISKSGLYTTIYSLCFGNGAAALGNTGIVVSSNHQGTTATSGVGGSASSIIIGTPMPHRDRAPEIEINVEPHTISAATDIAELGKMQMVVCRRMTETEESILNLDHHFQILKEIMKEQEIYFSGPAKEAIKKDNALRSAKFEESLKANHKLYKLIIHKQMELLEKQAANLGLLEKDYSNESDSIKKTVNNLTVPTGDTLSRRSSTMSSSSIGSGGTNTSLHGTIQSPSSSHSPSFRSFSNETSEVTLTKLVQKLKITKDIMSKWEAQHNFVEKFDLPRGEKLYFQITATQCFGMLTVPGTLYVYENYVCFHRLIRPESDRVIVPMTKVHRVLKAQSPLFFDNAIQIQLDDRKTSFHFGHLENRDDIRHLVQLFAARAEKKYSSEAALIELGIIAIEEIFENQRSGLLRGYSASRLLPIDACGPWSDEEGRPKNKEEVTLPNAFWQWSSPWKVDKTGQVDEEGWEYSIGWGTQWGTKNATTFVRRRKWIRTRIRLPEQITFDQLVKNVNDLPGNPSDSQFARKISIYDVYGNFAGYYLL